MTNDVLENLLKKTETKASYSYGIYNVNKRIQLLFGDDYGISASSEVGKGTTVNVRIKAITIE